MVNVSSIEAIDKFIISNKIRPKKKWSDRYRMSDHGKSWYLKKLVTKIRTILNVLSGNDLIQMLNDVLSDEQKINLIPSCYSEVLKDLVPFYKKTVNRKRHNIIRPFRLANFKYHQVRKIGYPVSRHLWKKCLNRTERAKGGRPTIRNELKEKIFTHCLNNSNISSNRLVKVNRQNVSARYLTENKSEILKSFENKRELGKSTFFKYVKKSRIYKNPHRFTDLCEYCEEALKLKKQIDGLIKEDKPDWENSINQVIHEQIETYSLLVSSNSNNNSEHELSKETISLLKRYQEINYHKYVAKSQRKAYNEQRSNHEILINKILIEVDFKQKIVTGMGPRQPSYEYYEQIKRTCLGFGIYYTVKEKQVDPNSGKEIEVAVIKMINFDIISSDQSQEARAVVRGFRILREQNWFKEIEKTDYIIWCDCGKHFRNEEVAGYLFIELKQHKIRVNLNFFGDKHGKNSRDTHFSHISRFIEEESKIKKLTSSQDIVEAILKRQKLANENKKKPSPVDEPSPPDNKEPKIIQTYAYALDFESESRLKESYKTNHCVSIQNIESFFNYQTVTDKFLLVTSGLSTLSTFIPLVKKSEDSFVEHTKYVVENEKTLRDPEVSISYIQTKKNRMIGLVKKINDQNGKAPESDKAIFSYFSVHFDVKDTLESTRNVQEPKYCREKDTKKKKKCIDCNEICSFSMEAILHPQNPIKQVDILEELEIHGHPKSRIIKETKLQRNTAEAAQELANHYEYCHKKKRSDHFF